MIKNFRSMLSNESGASLVEYALIIALISIVAVVAMQTLGTKVTNSLTTSANDI